MRVCGCIVVVLGLDSLFLFTGNDNDDTLLDDHYDALGYDPEFMGWESDSDE